MGFERLRLVSVIISCIMLGAWHTPVSAAVSITVTTVPEGKKVYVDSLEYTSPQTFSWAAGSSHTVAVNSTQGDTETRYVFTSWSDDGEQSHSVTVPTTVTTYTANLSTQFRLNVSVIPENSGTVALDPDGEWYAEGISVSLIALPAEDYGFSGWGGDLVYGLSSASLIMDAPKSVVAAFRQFPQIGVSPASLDFGNVPLGRSRDLSLVVGNTGLSDLEVTAIRISSSVLVASPNLFTVPADGTRSILVRFTPDGEAAIADTLTIVHSRAPWDTVTSVPISGQGVSIPLPTLGPSSLSFAKVKVGASRSLTLTIANPSSHEMQVTGVSLSDAAFSTATTELVVPAEGGMPLALTFTPIVGGPVSATVSIDYRIDGQVRAIRGTVTGEGLLPDIAVTSDTTRFGQLAAGESSDLSVTLQNAGNDTLDISAIRVVGPDSLSFRVADTEITLAPGGSDSVTVEFVPMSAGLKEASLVLTHNPTVLGTSTQIPLQGEGVGPPVRAEIDTSQIPDVIAFGYLAAGERDSSEVVIRNRGDGTLFVYQIASSDRQVSVQPESLQVEPGGAGRVQLVVQAGADADTSGVLEIRSNDPDRPTLAIPWLIAGAGCPGDFNVDGTVNFADFVLFAQAFGRSDPEFDLDGDGSVKFGDFVIFAQLFGTSCP